MKTILILFCLGYTIPGAGQLVHEVYYRTEGEQEWRFLTNTTEHDWTSAHWVRVDVNEGKPGKYVLQGGNWYMQGMTFYSANGMRVLGSGNSIEFIWSGPTSFLIHYPFVDEKSNNQIEIHLKPYDAFIKETADRDVFQSAFLSIIGFMALVSLFFSLGSKDRVYIHYAFYLFSILYFFAYQYGILGHWIPWVRHIPPSWLWISSASLTVGYILFARSFLELRTRDPLQYKIMHYGLYFILWVVVTESVSYLIGYDIQHSVIYKGFVVGVQLILMLFILYRVYLLKSVISRIFLLGLVVLVLTTLTAQTLSTFDQAFESNRIVQSGLLLDVFIFSIGMAVRTSRVYRERQQTQDELIEQLQLNERLQKEYTTQLESKVEQRTAELENRNRENELLLKEVHHRVKNNIQMISSLLNMQKRRLKDQGNIELLSLTQTRVRSIGLIHEHLYQYESLSRMHFKRYIEDLVNMLIHSLHIGHEIKVHIHVENYMAEIETAIPVGLVLNELVTNSIKYAFVDHPDPELTIELTEAHGKLNLLVKDNGLFDREIRNGFGWTIISTTLASIHGAYERQFNKGMEVRIEIGDYQISQMTG